MPKTRRNILTGKRPTKKRDWHSRAGSASKTRGQTQAIVPTFLHMLNTVKLYHWKTTSFSTHKATDELYGSLNDKLDEFV